ncbi:MAG: cyclin PHO80-like protein, partial [Piptocephalis tieghemiana]
FHARAAPSIQLETYLARIAKYCPAANEVFLALAVYAHRLLQAEYGPSSSTISVVDRFNVHRLCITGVVVASKFFSDVFFTNSRYAKVGGLPVDELNKLEILYLQKLNYSLHISPLELQH